MFTMIPAGLLLPTMRPTKTRHTSGVSRVDDAQDTRIAVLLGCIECSAELFDIQTPTIVLVQVVTNLHGIQVCQGG